MRHILVHQGYLALVGSSWKTISHDFLLVGYVIVALVLLTIVSLRTNRVWSPRTEELRAEES